MQQEGDSVQQQYTHMDKLTQTQNAIDDLIRIMYSSLSYLTRKASFVQLNPEIPITQTIPDAESPEAFEASKAELVTDFLRKAKQLEYLISVLPTPTGEEGSEDDLQELQNEMEGVNAEYLEAVSEAEALHKRLTDSLRAALEARTS